jgi:sugar lactone lactonase YvrE
MTVLAFGESPRWHDDRLWFSDWGAQAVVTVDFEGNRELIVRAPDLGWKIVSIGFKKLSRGPLAHRLFCTRR